MSRVSVPERGAAEREHERGPGDGTPAGGLQNLVVIHSSAFSAEQLRPLLSEKITWQQVRSLREIPPSSGTPRIVLLDSHLASIGDHRRVADASTALLATGLDRGEWIEDASIFLHLPAEPSAALLGTAIRRAAEYIAGRQGVGELKRQLRQRNAELEEMGKVAIALSTVRNHDVLLEMILSKCREISRADAGSLYLLDETDEEGKVLRWMLAQNDSIAVDFEQSALPLTRSSLAGYVAITGETLVIDDAYELPDDAEFQMNSTFDEATGYLTRSFLVFPMTNHAGDTIGVLQLINRKRSADVGNLTPETVPRDVVPFDEHTVGLMRSLASQAAVALENNILYDSIERLFEGFVTASVTAIEQRDPSTSGHSFRVADLTVELAKTVDRLGVGRFRDIAFTQEELKELRYASLLHDFGKVGVRESVLVKEKKLYPRELELIRNRFEYLIVMLGAEAQKQKLDHVMKYGTARLEEFAAGIDRELEQKIAAVEEDLEFLLRANEPTVLPDGDFDHLRRLGEIEYADWRGERRPLLTGEEIRILSIRKGNLDEAERREIESHVSHTFEFLSKIPWTRDLGNVPSIAWAHHEKLNGGGYPRKLDAGGIPVQSRMMTVSDIYDALTAQDRPYKKAVPTDRALDILSMEVKDGLLDPDLVEIFIDARIYERAGIVRR
jgi:HD-GYP domain-containing protein (c-di-GMP phosphodiesterase class II)